MNTYMMIVSYRYNYSRSTALRLKRKILQRISIQYKDTDNTMNSDIGNCITICNNNILGHPMNNDRNNGMYPLMRFVVHYTMKYRDICVYMMNNTIYYNRYTRDSIIHQVAVPYSQQRRVDVYSNIDRYIVCVSYNPPYAVRIDVQCIVDNDAHYDSMYTLLNDVPISTPTYMYSKDNNIIRVYSDNIVYSYDIHTMCIRRRRCVNIYSHRHIIYLYMYDRYIAYIYYRYRNNRYSVYMHVSYSDVCVYNVCMYDIHMVSTYMYHSYIYRYNDSKNDIMMVNDIQRRNISIYLMRRKYICHLSTFDTQFSKDDVYGNDMCILYRILDDRCIISYRYQYTSIMCCHIHRIVY